MASALRECGMECGDRVVVGYLPNSPASTNSTFRIFSEGGRRVICIILCQGGLKFSECLKKSSPSGTDRILRLAVDAVRTSSPASLDVAR